MATETKTITRGGETYTITIGTNNGNSELCIEPATPDKTGNTIRYELKEFTVPFGSKSAVGHIYTKWRRLLIGPTGEIVHQGKEFTVEPAMISNSQDQADFIMAMAMPILRSMVNGFVRKILGFNNLRVFHPVTGAWLTYTPEQEAEEPTNDYDPLPTLPTPPTE